MGWRPSGGALLLAAAWALNALPAALVAGDFQVNTYTTGQQSLPIVAATADGGFVIAWTSVGSFGSDTSNASVQARRYGPDGVPLGPEFQVNTFTPDNQFTWGQNIAEAPDGRFVVTWQSAENAAAREVRGQRYSSDGAMAGSEIQVNTYTTGDQEFASVAMDAMGGFIVAWQGLPGLDVWARRFASDGTPLAGDFQVNTYTTMEQRYPSVAYQPGGSFVVTWSSDGSFGNDTSLTSVQTRLYASDGTPLGPEFQVNTYTVGDQWISHVGVNPVSGDFVVVWNSTRFTSEFDIAARRYSAAGAPLGDEFLVNTYTTGQQLSGATIAVAPSGEFVVSWLNKPVAFAPPLDCSACDIRARRFRADGTPYAPEFLVNSYSTTGWRDPYGVAVDGSGNFIVTWHSEGSPGNDDDNWSIQGAREVSELQVSNDDGVSTAVPGGSLTYTIRASHVTGLQAVVSATVTDAFSPMLACTWTCVGVAGGACTPGPVSGPISDPVVLPVGSSVTYTANCAISATATGSIVTTATVAGPPGLFDPVPANNAATDIDGLQGLVIDDVSALEGNAGVTAFGFTVTLASPLLTPATVDYGTSDGTATAGADYLAASGTLTFAPGETTKAVTVSVFGDTVFEADETFFVTLSNAVGSMIVDGLGVGTILNDDSAQPSGSLDELVHGSVETRSLETLPGPVAVAQEWRVRQAPNASYEVVVDGVTGDLGPDGPALDRLASDGSVLQGAVGASGGSSRSLRFENHGAAVTDQRIRVQSRGCITDCDAADTFRIRLFETTLSGARFNNSATQVTVLVVQDASEESVSGHVDFWSPGGVLLHSEPLTLGPRQTLVLNTATLGALQGQAGSLTISHDGRYGALLGKAAAVEPATGFSFDTPLVPRRR